MENILWIVIRGRLAQSAGTMFP